MNDYLAEEQRRTADALERMATALETKQQYPVEPDGPTRGLVYLWIVITVCQLLLIASVINDIS